jgi:type IV secretion/conjugal transfer VirB4 family ATPase
MSDEFIKHQKNMENRLGLADRLGFGYLVNDNAVVMKDGSLLAAFQFYGDDVDSVTEEMRIAYSLRWSQAVSSLWTENLMIQVVTSRERIEKYSENDKFDNIVSTLIDKERSYQFNSSGDMFESKTYVVITANEDKQLSKNTKRFIYNNEEQSRDLTPTEKVNKFTNKLRQFINYVSLGNHNKFRRLAGDELITYFHQSITGTQENMLAPDSDTMLDIYLSRCGWLPGHSVEIGNKHVKTLSIDNYPAKIHPMLMNLLNTLAIEFKYCTRYALLSKKQADSELKRLQSSWSSKAIGMKGVLVQAFGGVPKLDQAAESKNQETQICIAENEDGEIKYGFYTATFVLFNEDLAELNNNILQLKDAIQNLNFVLREEVVNSSESYLGTLPGHGGYDCRLIPFDSIGWSYLLPIAGIYAGEAKCPNPYYPKESSPLFYAATGDCNIYRYNSQVEDVGHGKVLGPTGGGKTTAIGLMMSSHKKYPNNKIIMLDKDASSKYTILAHGGKYYDPSDLAIHKIAPFTNIEDKYSFELIHKWLCETFAINGVTMTAERRGELSQALKRLANLIPNERKFSNLVIQEEDLRSTFRNLKASIFGEIMDGTDDHILNNSLVGIDIGRILGLAEQYSSPIIRCLLNKVDISADRKVPTLLFIEEGWMLLDREEYRNEIKDWLKTYRKKLVSVIFISQSLSDIAKSAIKDILMESCPTKIYLPNPEALQSDVRQQYKDFGLNDSQINLIATATPKKDYYIVQPQGQRLVDFNLGEVTLAFLGISSNEQIERFNKHFDINNNEWAANYLDACDLKDAANYVRENLLEVSDA